MSEKADYVKSEQEAAVFQNLVKSCVARNDFERVKKLFAKPADAAKYGARVDMRLFADLCIKHLTKDIFKSNLSLYRNMEWLLETIAKYAPVGEFITAAVNLFKQNSSIKVYVSALKALKFAVLRRENSAQLEWCLEQVLARFQQMPIPVMFEGLRHISFHDVCMETSTVPAVNATANTYNRTPMIKLSFTLLEFYEPLLNDIMQRTAAQHQKHLLKLMKQPFDCRKTERQILCCFLVKLLHYPISEFNVDQDKLVGGAENPCRKIMHKLRDDITTCLGDPLSLLRYVELRTCRASERHSADDKPQDYYASEAHLPMLGIGKYFYALMSVAHSYDPDTARDRRIWRRVPQVYAPGYIFESILYLVVALWCEPDNVHELFSLQLMRANLVYLKKFINVLPDNTMQRPIYEDIFRGLSYFPVYSEINNRRTLFFRALKDLLASMLSNDLYAVIEMLLSCKDTPDNTVGLLAVHYKNSIAILLKKNPNCLPDQYNGERFRKLLFLAMDCLAHKPLPPLEIVPFHSTGTRVLDVLSCIYFYAKVDRKNLTGFWHHIDEIKRKFLQPLKAKVFLPGGLMYVGGLKYVGGEKFADAGHMGTIRDLDASIQKANKCSNAQDFFQITNRTQESETYAPFRLIARHLTLIEKLVGTI